MEKIITRNFICSLRFEIPRLQSYLHNNTSATLEFVNIKNLRIRKFAWFSCFYITYEGVGPIAK